MVPCSVPHLRILTLLALGALAACERAEPPAPVIFGAAPAPEAVLPAPLAPVAAAQPKLPTPEAARPASLAPVVTARPSPPAPAPVALAVPRAAPSPAITIRPPEPVAAAPPPPPVPPSTDHPDRLLVARGDSLSAVSRRFGIPVPTLIAANDLKPPFKLVAGQTLTLPHPTDSPALAASAAPHTDATAAPLPPLHPPPRQPPPPVAANTAPPHGETAMLAPAPSAKGFIWPVRGRILGGYGDGPGGTHNDGINIAAAPGTPVAAAAAGTVAYAGNELKGYGYLILLKHPDGMMTAYAHNSVLRVKRGDVVKRGQTIAEVGNSGAVSEPQLHFEVRRGTHALDPADYLPDLDGKG